MSPPRMHTFRLTLGIGLLFVGLQPGSGEQSSSQNEVEITVVETVYDGQDIDYNKIGEYNNCGYSSKRESRQVELQTRDYPWMAILAAVAGDEMRLLCGGSVVTRRHILTAAHCFDQNPVPNMVRLGEYDLTRDNDSKQFDYAINEVRIHEDYDMPTHQHDIAIIVLDGLISYNPNIQPICLPPPKEVFIHENVFVAGWGETQYKGSTSPVLLETAFPVWNKTMCKERLPCTVFPTNLCAGYIPGGRDACRGDSGGPLMKQRDDGRWIAVAIVSYGYGCAGKKTPGVYTQISDYLEWIAPRIQDVEELKKLE